MNNNYYNYVTTPSMKRVPTPEERNPQRVPTINYDRQDWRDVNHMRNILKTMKNNRLQPENLNPQRVPTANISDVESLISTLMQEVRTDASEDINNNINQEKLKQEKINTQKASFDLQNLLDEFKKQSKSSKGSIKDIYKKLEKDSLIDYSPLYETPSPTGESPLESFSGWIGSLFGNEQGGKDVGRGLSKQLVSYDPETGTSGGINTLLRSIIASTDPHGARVMENDIEAQRTADQNNKNFNRRLKLKETTHNNQVKNDIKLSQIATAQKEAQRFDKLADDLQSTIINNDLEKQHLETKHKNDIILQELKNSVKSQLGTKPPTAAAILSTYNKLIGQSMTHEEAIKQTMQALNDLNLNLTSSEIENAVNQDKHFTNVEEAEKANLPVGTIIYINGRKAKVS